MANRNRRASHGAGSVRYNAERKRYRVQVTLQSGRRTNAWVKTAEEGHELVRQIVERDRKHAAVSDSREPFADYLVEWLAARNLRETTRVTYWSPIEKHVIPGLGDVALRDITSEMIGKLLVALRDGKVSKGNPEGRKYSPATVRHVFTYIYAALKSAVPHKLAANPADTEWVRQVLPSKASKEGLGRTRSLTDTDWDRLVAVCGDTKPGRRLKPIIQLLVATGMRRSEILGLRWSDINFDAEEPELRVEQGLQRVARAGGKLHFLDPKSLSSQRDIPLITRALEALREQHVRQAELQLKAGARWKNEYGLVFTTDFGHPLEPRNVTRDFQTACKRAGLEHTRLHDLRHTTATWMIEAGVDISKVSRVLGHSSIHITMQYYHNSKEHDRAALQSIDDRIAAGGR